MAERAAPRDELTELTAEMKAAIGRSGDPIVHEVSAQGIRTFARAVGHSNPIYYDADAARDAGHPALPAPPGFLGLPVFDPTRPAAPGRPAFPSPFKRVLNGGTEVEPISRVYAGDVLHAVTTLANLELRRGRMGQMLIRTSETIYTRVRDGEIVARVRGTGISY